MKLPKLFLQIFLISSFAVPYFAHASSVQGTIHHISKSSGKHAAKKEDGKKVAEAKVMNLFHLMLEAKRDRGQEEAFLNASTQSIDYRFLIQNILSEDWDKISRDHKSKMMQAMPRYIKNALRMVLSHVSIKKLDIKRIKSNRNFYLVVGISLDAFDQPSAVTVQMKGSTYDDMKIRDISFGGLSYVDIITSQMRERLYEANMNFDVFVNNLGN